MNKVQTYLDRVVAGATEAEFAAEFPHPVLVELEQGQTSDTDAGMMTERLDSHNIRLQSKTSRDANVFEIAPDDPGRFYVSNLGVGISRRGVNGWQHMSGSPDYAYDIEIDPDDSRVLYATNSPKKFEEQWDLKPRQNK